MKVFAPLIMLILVGVLLFQPQKSDETKVVRLHYKKTMHEVLLYNDLMHKEVSCDVLIPQGTGFKSYMDWRKITDKTSNQWALQQYSYTDGSGLRKYQDRFMVALGTGYADYIGQKVNIHFDDGAFIPCVVGDFKANEHTDLSNRVHLYDGSVVEFIVDVRILPERVRICGDVSALGIKGKVVRIEEVP